MEDRELIARILRGEEVNRCLALLMEKYRVLLFTVARRMLGGRRDAEEVVQDTWVIALRRLPQFDPGLGKLSSWLCGITIRLCLHVWRKRKRVARSEAAERCCCLDSSPGPEERHEQLVWHERLWLVLSGLPRLWQALLVLHIQECWTYQQLAKAFGFSERHAKYETNRALAAAQHRALELGLAGWR